MAEWNFVNLIPVLGHVKCAVHKMLNQEKEAEETFQQANGALLRAMTGIESGNENSMSMQNKAEEYNGSPKCEGKCSVCCMQKKDSVKPPKTSRFKLF